MGRLADGRSRLNAWGDGPAMPGHDALDVNHVFKYFERRALLVALAALLVWQGLVALALHLLWPRLAVGVLLTVSAICFFWPACWHLYLRHHYKPEFRSDPSPEKPR